MNKSTFKRVRGVKRMCGSYASWDEIGTYCDWIFGEYFIGGDFLEELEEELEIPIEELKKMEKDKLDSIIKDYVKDYSDDYCDIQIDWILIELNDKNEIIKTYIEI